MHFTLFFFIFSFMAKAWLGLPLSLVGAASLGNYAPRIVPRACIFWVGLVRFSVELSWAELSQARVKRPAKCELSSAYAWLTVENQTEKRAQDCTLRDAGWGFTIKNLYWRTEGQLQTDCLYVINFQSYIHCKHLQGISKTQKFLGRFLVFLR